MTGTSLVGPTSARSGSVSGMTGASPVMLTPPTEPIDDLVGPNGVHQTRTAIPLLPTHCSNKAH